MKNRKLDWVGWIVPAILLAVWWFAAQFGLIAPYQLPSPQTLLWVLVDFATGWYGLTPYAGTMALHLWHSLYRVLTGFALAAVLGIPLGFATGRVPLLRRLFDPFLGLIRSVPGVGWLPVAIVWLGVGEANTRFLITLAAFFPIYLNTMQGAAGVCDLTVRAGRMLGARGLTLFATVIFPAAFAQIAVGLRLGLGVAWAYLVLGEVTGVNAGLGAVMNDGRMLGQVDIVLAAMIVIALAGRLTDWTLCALCRRSSPMVRKGGMDG